MKVIITGASGLLGRAVVKTFEPIQGVQVIGTAFSRANDKLFKLDLTAKGAVESFVAEHKPDAFVHCAAERRPDVAEKDPELVERLNVRVPEQIAQTCQKHGVMLIYISTDYVFDGTAPPYDVDDKPHPLNIYGESKLAGEHAIQKVYPEAVILRVPILYGLVESNNESAVTVLIDAVKNQGKTVQMDNVGIRYPTHVQDVGRVIKDLIVNKLEHQENISGIFHFSAQESFTKYSMCLTFAEIMDVTVDHIEPQNSVPSSAAASRPKDAHLSVKRLQEYGIDVTFIPFKEWFRTHL